MLLKRKFMPRVDETGLQLAVASQLRHAPDASAQQIYRELRKQRRWAAVTLSQVTHASKMGGRRPRTAVTAAATASPMRQVHRMYTRVAGPLRTAVCVSGLWRTWHELREEPTSPLQIVDRQPGHVLHHFMAVGHRSPNTSVDPGPGLEGFITYASDAYKAAKREGVRMARGFPAAFGNLQCWRLLTAREAQEGWRYDWVVRARTDTAVGLRVRLTRPPDDERVYSSRLGSCGDRPMGDEFSTAAEPWGCIKDLFAVMSRGAATAYYAGLAASYRLETPEAKAVSPHGGSICPECRLGRVLHLVGRASFHLLPGTVFIVRHGRNELPPRLRAGIKTTYVVPDASALAAGDAAVNASCAANMVEDEGKTSRGIRCSATPIPLPRKRPVVRYSTR